MFVPAKPFQPSPMYVGKTRSLPQSGAPEWYFTGADSGLTQKHEPGTNTLAYYGNSFNMDVKSFITLGSGIGHFGISQSANKTENMEKEKNK